MGLVEQVRMLAALDEIVKLYGLKVGTSQHNAFLQGVEDGMEQGPELSSGMSYEDGDHQQAYDAGTWFGAGIWALEQGVSTG